MPQLTAVKLNTTRPAEITLELHYHLTFSKLPFKYPSLASYSDLEEARELNLLVKQLIHRIIIQKAKINPTMVL